MRFVILLAFMLSVVFGRVVCEDKEYEVIFSSPYTFSVNITGHYHDTSDKVLSDMFDPIKDKILSVAGEAVEAKRKELLDNGKCVKVGFSK